MTLLTEPYDATTQYFVAPADAKVVQRISEAMLNSELGSSTEPDFQFIAYPKARPPFKSIRFKELKDIMLIYETLKKDRVKAEYYSRAGEDGPLRKWLPRTMKAAVRNNINSSLVRLAQE